jgi:MFS family permease
MPEAPPKPGRVAFRHPAFRLYWFARVLAVLAVDAQVTAVGWQVYRITGDALSLGLVGLAQFGPFFLLFLPSGAAADRFRRIQILRATLAVQAACAIAFLVITVTGTATFPAIMGILVVLGATRAFQMPSLQAIVPLLVPPRDFGNAVAWSTLGFGTARIVGPALAGALLILGEGVVYGFTTVLLAASLMVVLRMRVTGQAVSRERPTLRSVLAGFRFIWSRKVILGAISLDLFAVLLGGATALLPIFAVDVLGVGEVGFGALRAAQVLGELAGAFVLTQRPLRRRAGRSLLVAVAVFGAATCVFGLSTVFWLSFLALFTLGAADAFSMFIRSNLVQIVTPDDKRGRVSAVNGIFIGASNELGQFESGITAAWWGVVPAVLVGGIGTIAVAVVFAFVFPALRRVDSLDPDDLVQRYRDLPGRAPAEAE